MTGPVSDNDRQRMRTIDVIHLEDPSLGFRDMKNVLRLRGFTVDKIHV